ncbi:MAG: dihydroorotate dehydrogenase-like protein [Bacteroidales bacterium]
MLDLSVKYLGLQLKNPLIVGSCGLTNSAEDVKNLEKLGAGAVILKSIFEEEIRLEYEKEMNNVSFDDSNLEYYDYFDYQIKETNIKRYISLIEACKKNVKIPVIGSINCNTAADWTFFARKIQDAGADALELNAFFLPTDIHKTSSETEKMYFDLIENVKKEVSIPVSLKISFYFSNLASFIKQISEKVDGVVLFNRFYSPDIDIENRKIISTNVLSSPSDLSMPLRWIAIMANRVDCSLAASTGVHDGEAVIKQLLVGADAVQVVSAFYKNGVSYLKTILHDVELWMKENSYRSISDFKGSLSQVKSQNPALVERVQFMKYFGEMKS